MKIYLAICRNKFCLYDDTRKIIHIDGDPFFEYEPNKIRNATFRLMDKVVDESNLSSKSDLCFFVIDNSDNLRNEGVAKELGNLLVKKYSLDGLLRQAINELGKNPKLYVSEFGVNYDGECYRLENELLVKGEYNLLALSIEPNELLKFID